MTTIKDMKYSSKDEISNPYKTMNYNPIIYDYDEIPISSFEEMDKMFAGIRLT